MKKLLYLAAVCCMFSCAKTQEFDDPAKLNQPVNPTTWSPVGKVYKDSKTTILSFLTDSTYCDAWKMGEINGFYRVDYPTLYKVSKLFNNEEAWMYFEDTLTLQPFANFESGYGGKLVLSN